MTCGDNFKPVSPETAAWVLQQHFAMNRFASRPAIGFSGHRHKPETRARIGQTRIERFCERAGITAEERLEYMALIRSKGLRAHEALQVIKGSRKA